MAICGLNDDCRRSLSSGGDLIVWAWWTWWTCMSGCRPVY